jgi:hypothetical protein
MEDGDLARKTNFINRSGSSSSAVEGCSVEVAIGTKNQTVGWSRSVARNRTVIKGVEDGYSPLARNFINYTGIGGSSRKSGSFKIKGRDLGFIDELLDLDGSGSGSV